MIYLGNGRRTKIHFIAVSYVDLKINVIVL